MQHKRIEGIYERKAQQLLNRILEINYKEILGEETTFDETIVEDIFQSG